MLQPAQTVAFLHDFTMKRNGQYPGRDATRSRVNQEVIDQFLKLCNMRVKHFLVVHPNPSLVVRSFLLPGDGLQENTVSVYRLIPDLARVVPRDA